MGILFTLGTEHKKTDKYTESCMMGKNIYLFEKKGREKKFGFIFQQFLSFCLSLNRSYIFVQRHFIRAKKCVLFWSGREILRAPLLLG